MQRIFNIEMILPFTNLLIVCKGISIPIENALPLP
jgi:hypothetical protein